MIETILSLRSPDETFRGQINVMKANAPNTPRDEIEKALVSNRNNIKSLELTSFLGFRTSFNIKMNHSIFLRISQEYLYDDVPKADCSSESKAHSLNKMNLLSVLIHLFFFHYHISFYFAISW